MESFLDTLTPDVTVVTATQRLARVVHGAYNARQRDKGLQVWESIDVLPWNAWCQRSWEAGLGTVAYDPSRPMPILLNPLQEQILWEQSIATFTQDQPLLQIPSTARAAREAWRLIHAWQLDTTTWNDWLNDDVQVFLSWAHNVKTQCEQNTWLDEAQLQTVLAQYFKSEILTAPHQLCLMGFDELSPQQQILISALKDSGCNVTEFKPPHKSNHVVRVTFNDTLDEIKTVTRWASALLEDNALTRIGVVVPQLNDLRATIERIFDESLVPLSSLPAYHEQPRPYNISVGRPLGEYSIVHAALLILELATGELPLDKVGELLRSPFLAAADSEMTRRGLLDAQIRRIGELTVPLKTLRFRARGVTNNGSTSAYSCPELYGRLEQCHIETQSFPRRQSARAWVKSFSHLLNVMGWPGERSLNSVEYQTIQAFQSIMSDLPALDLLAPTIQFKEALNYLRRLTTETQFQPQGTDVPIQILGTLEAAGIEFDHLWIMGLHDEVWPVAPQPSPFLPVAIQRKFGLPHASPDREFHFTRQVTDRLLQSAGHVVVSSPNRDGDRELRPSPLIVRFNETSSSQLSLQRVSEYRQIIHQSRDLERMQDNKAPPLADDDKDTRIQGGTGIFKDQAACPFRAFANYRLGASTIEQGTIGLGPLERGILVHALLENIWNELKDFSRLSELPDSELQALVTRIAQQTVSTMAQQRPQTFTERFTLLEVERLMQLTMEWLQLEKQRLPFTVIKPEQERVVSIGGLTIKTKIDRIDKLHDGRYAIIDYKTGNPKVSHWSGDRPEDPQLPLYCVTGKKEHKGENIAALVFAQVKTGSLGFIGIAQDGDLLPGVKSFSDTKDYKEEFTSWEVLINHWRDVIRRLGEDFRLGKASVVPKQYPQTCENCVCSPLCRINEVSEEVELLDTGEVADE